MNRLLICRTGFRLLFQNPSLTEKVSLSEELVVLLILLRYMCILFHIGSENLKCVRLPAQVQIILDHLMSDRRIARAAHPIINAWRCKANGILYQGLFSAGHPDQILMHLQKITTTTEKPQLVVVCPIFSNFR